MFTNGDGALKRYREAVRLNPSRGEYLQQLASALSVRGDFGAAERLFRASIKYDPSNPNRYFKYAAWLLHRGCKQRAMQNLNRVIAMAPQKIDESLTLMVIHGLTEKEMQSVVPMRIEPYLRFGDFLHQTGNDVMAEAIYRDALEFVSNGDRIKSVYFENVSRFYIEIDQPAKALAVLQKAIQVLPENLHLFVKTVT